MKFELAKVEQWNLGLSAGAVAASLALVTPHFATSLAAGAFLEALNLGAIHRAAKRLFDGQVMTGAWVGGFALRFMMLGAGIFAVMYVGAHPVALLIGLSIAMPATLIDAWLNRPPILDPATLPTFLDDEDFYADPNAHAVSGASHTAGTAGTAARTSDEDPNIFQTGNLFPLKWTDPLEDVESEAHHAASDDVRASASFESTSFENSDADERTR
ncbi:MAG: ATP synthase subunit I [Myxococcota bacterium]